jgi:beta-1,4-mannosyltransferase
MTAGWFDSWWELCLAIAVLASTSVTIFLCTLPSTYSSFQSNTVTEESFTDEDREDTLRSGYAYFQKHRDEHKKMEINTSLQVVVLGDIGRSPRMQYHALSIATHGGKVDLIGYVESEVHPDIQANRLINVIPISQFPKQLQSGNKVLFLLVAPLKIVWQTVALYYALCYATTPSKWMLVQNPPSIPTLTVAQLVCFLRNTRLVIDWHNFGYSILALRLGHRHPLVKIAEWYEGFFSLRAAAHFAVTNAMVKVLADKWKIKAMALHDRPPLHFQPLSKGQKQDFLSRSSETASHFGSLEKGTTKLLVSSTSWTADEDFSLLLQALVDYSATRMQDKLQPDLLVIITGKGPQKAYYLDQIAQLEKQDKLSHVVIKTAWLSIHDYASLLGSADVGISLHTSSSGVDLPMKVVDMLGTGLPVLGWSKFEAWPELIREGENGCGFSSSEDLTRLLQDLFSGDGLRLEHLREDALRDCDRRWDDEWMPVAGQLFQLK